MDTANGQRGGGEQGWRQVGSHAAVVGVARDDGRGCRRRARHVIVAVLLALAGAGAVILTLGPKRGKQLAEITTASNSQDLVPTQQLGIKIPGIRAATQAIIDSGAWDDKAVQDDMLKGLLPPPKLDDNTFLPDDSKTSGYPKPGAPGEIVGKPEVVPKPYVPPPPGESPPKPVIPPHTGGIPGMPGNGILPQNPAAEPSPAAAVSTEGESQKDKKPPGADFFRKGAKPGQPGGPPPPDGKPNPKQETSTSPESGAPLGREGSAQKKGLEVDGNETNANETDSRDTEKGMVVDGSESDFTVQGHCSFSPSTDCTKDEECSQFGGGCLFWTCLSDPKTRCANTADCASTGGICTGPGHCSGEPELKCSQDEECSSAGGACVTAGYCSALPSLACVADTDCGDKGGSCLSAGNEWWKADENFPKDYKLGPYSSWSRLEMHKKLLIVMLKVLHMQSDLESQVPINAQFMGQIRWLQSFLKGSNLELTDNVNDGNLLMLKNVEIVHQKLYDDQRNLARDILAMDSMLKDWDVKQDKRLHGLESSWPEYNRTLTGMSDQAYDRSTRLWRDTNETDLYWNATAKPWVIPIESGADRSVAVERGAEEEGIGSYKTFANYRYNTGYHKLYELFENFKYLTEEKLSQIERWMQKVNITIPERHQIIIDWLNQWKTDGLADLLANATKDEKLDVDTLMTEAIDEYKNQSVSMEELKASVKEKAKAAAAFAEAKAKAAAAAKKAAAAAAAVARGTGEIPVLVYAYNPLEYICGDSNQTVTSCDNCPSGCFAPESAVNNRDTASDMAWHPDCIPDKNNVWITLDAGAFLDRNGQPRPPEVKAVLWANDGDERRDPSTLKIETADDPSGPWTEVATLDMAYLQGTDSQVAIPLPEPVTAHFFKLSPGNVSDCVQPRIIGLCWTDDCLEPPVPPAPPKPPDQGEIIRHLADAVDEISEFLKKVFPNGPPGAPSAQDACCATDCAAAPAGPHSGLVQCLIDGPPPPLTVDFTEKTIDEPATDRGNGENWYLVDQNVDCGNDVINGFHMRTIDEMSKITYRVKCSKGAVFDKTKVKSTEFQDAGGGNIIYLDRLDVDCGADAAVSQFRLVRNPHALDQMKYEYTCKSDDPESFFECEDLATAPNDGGDGGNKIEFLDRHSVICPADKVLQQFKLDTTGGGQPGGKIKYNYRCCSVTGQLNEATMFLGIPKAQAEEMSDSQMRGAVIALLMKAGKCTPETAGWCASQSDDELAALCAPGPTPSAEGESPAPAPPTVEVHAEPTRGWQLRVWKYPNAGSGEFPEFDSGTDSFKMPEPPIIDKEAPYMMYDDQRWKELGAPHDNFAAVLTGFLDVKEAGQYDFWTESDDGSMLWIDNAMVVDNHGLHGPEKKTGTVSLSKGIHPILVQFFEAGGGALLTISWKGPDTAGAELPVDVFQKAAAPPASGSASGSASGTASGVSSKVASKVAPKKSQTPPPAPPPEVNLCEAKSTKTAQGVVNTCTPILNQKCSDWRDFADGWVADKQVKELEKCMQADCVQSLELGKSSFGLALVGCRFLDQQGFCYATSSAQMWCAADGKESDYCGKTVPDGPEGWIPGTFPYRGQSAGLGSVACSCMKDCGCSKDKCWCVSASQKPVGPV